MDYAFWFNVVQNVILIATLLLVFWQLRQVERATRRDAMMRAVEDHDRLNEILLQYPKLNTFFGSPETYAEWQPDEINFMNFLTLALGRFERLHVFREEGYVEDALWNSWTKWVKETWLASPLARKIWELEGPFYSLPFQRFINELLSESRDKS
jgi:hypothetical protein